MDDAFRQLIGLRLALAMRGAMTGLVVAGKHLQARDACCVVDRSSSKALLLVESTNEADAVVAILDSIGTGNGYVTDTVVRKNARILSKRVRRWAQTMPTPTFDRIGADLILALLRDAPWQVDDTGAHVRTVSFRAVGYASNGAELPDADRDALHGAGAALEYEGLGIYRARQHRTKETSG